MWWSASKTIEAPTYDFSGQETGIVSAEVAENDGGRQQNSSDIPSDIPTPTTPLPLYITDRDWPIDEKYDVEYAQSPTASLHNEKVDSQDTSIVSLSTGGFSSSERKEHLRTVRYMATLRFLAVSRLAFRALAILVSAAAFILITVTLLLFAKFRKSNPNLTSVDPEYPNSVKIHITPATFFASISGIFTIISFSINLLCCISPKMRKITPLSNLVFGVVSVIGFAGWLGSCLYLEHNRNGKANFWYFVCDVASAYKETGGNGLPAQGNKFVQFCSYTSNSWNLGILQLVLEILTFINVVVAWLMIKSGTFRMAH